MDLVRRIESQGQGGTDNIYSDPRAPSHAVRHRVFAEGQRAPKLMYAAFEFFNNQFFGDKLMLPLILVTTPSSPRAWADYIDKDVQGLQSRIRLGAKVFDNGDLFALDVLLHELIHAWQAEIVHDREMGYRGHGPKFAAKCNEIGAVLGLPKVGVKGRDGLPDCAQWPMCVRPPEYYGPVKPKPERKKREPRPEPEPSPPEGRSRLEECIRELERVGYDVINQKDAPPDQRVAWRISEFLRVQDNGNGVRLPIAAVRKALPDVRQSVVSSTLLEMEQMGMLLLQRVLGTPYGKDGILVEGRGLLTYVLYRDKG